MKKYNNPAVIFVNISFEDVIKTSLALGNADDEMKIDFDSILH